MASSLFPHPIGHHNDGGVDDDDIGLYALRSCKLFYGPIDLFEEALPSGGSPVMRRRGKLALGMP